MRRKRERLGRPQGPLRDEIERAHRLEEIDSADAEQSLRERAAQLSAAFQLDKQRALDLLRRELFQW